MWNGRPKIRALLRSIAAAWLVVLNLVASEQHGVVTFGGLPVPGATVTATQGEKKVSAVTDSQGAYSFPDLADGVWTIQVKMLGFSPVQGEITAGPDAKPAAWEMKMLPLDQIHAEAQAAVAPKPVAPKPAVAPPAKDAATAAGTPRSPNPLTAD